MNGKTSQSPEAQKEIPGEALPGKAKQLETPGDYAKRLNEADTKARDDAKKIIAQSQNQLDGALRLG